MSRISVFVPLVMVSASTAVAAQTRSFELGIGVATAQFIDYPTSGASTSASYFSVGAQSASIAYYVSRHVSVELSLLASVSQADSVTASQVDLSVAVPVYFGGHDGRDGGYLAPRVGMARANYADGVGTRQISIGVGVGHKFPLTDVLSLRLEANLTHAAADETDGVVVAPAFTRVGGDASFSVFF